MMSQAESYVILLSRYRVYIYREDYAHQEKELETVGHDSVELKSVQIRVLSV